MNKKETPNGEIESKDISQKQIDSSKRLQVLSKHVSKAINDAHIETGEHFSLLEVIHVMNQNINVYVKHGLKQEWS